MGHCAQEGASIGDDLVGGFALDVAYETDTARVTIELVDVET